MERTREMEEANYGGQAEEMEIQYCSSRIMSPEIVEIIEDNKTTVKDVYVAVGKDDMDVLQWALDNHAVSPGARVFLVHVFPPITYIHTPGNTNACYLSSFPFDFLSIWPF
jgi:hypothetical protein